MKSLAILGASGHGKVVADVATQCDWRKISFYDDAWPQKEKIGDWDIKGSTDVLLDSLNEYDGVFVAIGDNEIRKQKLDEIIRAGGAVQILIHPAATVSRFASIGAGTVVMPGVVVNIDSQIGQGVVLNTGCTVDHDCMINDAVHISPGVHLAGNVFVGAMSWIGVGSSVIQNVNIGKNVTVGAGAVVLSDLPAGVTAVGVPARF